MELLEKLGICILIIGALITLFFSEFSLAQSSSLSNVTFSLSVNSSLLNETSLDGYHACVENETGDYFVGWSFSGKSPLDTSVASSQIDNTINISVSKKTNSTSRKAFLAFSKRSCGNLDLREKLIKDKEFLDGNFPSFSYKMPDKYSINITLSYNKLNITNDERISKGKYLVRLRNNGILNEKMKLSVDVL